jgi:glycosyltransferase involved in cell wall biosynthesis
MLYSVVVPLKDEEENVRQLVQEVEAVMQKMGKPWELLLIDDGSTDNTLQILKALQREKKFIRILSFDKNYGQSSAFEAGFKRAKGQWVITLDGDLQNDPADIPRLIDRCPEADLITGIRQKRKDTFFKKGISRIANGFRSFALQDGIEDTGCSLKIYRKCCLDEIKMYHGMHRFLPALFQIEGFKVIQIPVSHRKRSHGTTKYNLFNRSVNTVLDLLAVRWMRKRKRRWKIKEQLP